MAAGRAALYLTNIFALTLGFIVLVGLQYGPLWLGGQLFNPLPDPGLVPLVDDHRRPVRAAAGDLRRHRDLHLAADRLQPARRPDLRAVRDLVRGGRDRDPGGVLAPSAA